MKKSVQYQKVIIATATTIAFAASVVLTAPAQAATTKLTIWSFGNVIDTTLQAEYAKLHPEIEIVIKKGDLDQHHSGLKNALYSNVQPDIAAVELSYMGEFRNYSKYLTDLNTLTPSASTIKEDFLPWRWDQMKAPGGEQLGIPTDVGGLAVAYRVDLFKKAGLPTDRDKVSALWPTWEKYIEVGKQYKAKTKSNFVDTTGAIFGAVLNQGTEKYVSADGRPIYDTNPTVQRAFTTTANASNAKIGSLIPQYSPDWGVGMNKGTFATILAPAWMLTYIKQYAPKTKGLWDVASVPGKGGNMGGSALTIPKKAAHVKEAWDFIQWYLAPEQQTKLFLDPKNGAFPTTISAYTNPKVLGYKDPFFNNAPIGAIYSQSATSLKPIALGNKDRTIDNTFGQALSRVLLGKQSSSAAWGQALSDIKRAVG